jgi:hypothetical protein
MNNLKSISTVFLIATVASLLGLPFWAMSQNSGRGPAPDFDDERGKAIFEGKAKCASCHVPPMFTEPGWNMHTAAEIGIDDFQANRAPDRRYRTAPLKGLWTHQKGGFNHDGRFATLQDVVEHYDRFFNLGLSEQEEKDLVK